MSSAPTVASTSKLFKLALLVRDFPVTVAMLVLVTAATAAVGGLGSGLPDDVLAAVGIDLDSALENWWALLTSAFLSSSWLTLMVLLLVIAVGMGLAERIVGSWRTAAMFLVGQVVASLALVGLVVLGTAENDSWLVLLGGNYVVGAYGGVAAALAAATSSLNNLWRHRVRTWLVAFAVMFVLYVGTAETLQLLAGAVFGIVVGRTLGTGRRIRTSLRFTRSSLRESRFLLATVVGVFAVGPLLAQFTAGFSIGPLSTVGVLTLQGRPDANELSEMCNGDAACMDLQRICGVDSVGALVLSIIPLLLLLVCSEGLRRGRRLAMWTAVVINALVALVVAMAFIQFLVATQYQGNNVNTGLLAIYILPAAVVPAGIAILLLVYRDKFPVDPGSAATRKLLLTTGCTALAVLLLFTLMWFVEGNFGRLQLFDLLRQLTHILIPFPMPFVVALPQGFSTVLIYGFGGAIIWLVFGVLSFKNLRLYSAELVSAVDNRARVRELLHLGGGSLSWMALWKNNSYWYTADGKNAVAYQNHNGVALTVSGPFGAVESQAAAARGFAEHCVERGLIPCFYSADAAVGRALEGNYFQRLEVAEETLLNIAAMTFKGKEWQNVRTAMNRADKLGIQDHWSSYLAMPVGMRAQLAAISEEWVSNKSLPEMGFTLGGLDELKDEQVLCCVAVDKDGLVHGVTSWLPVFTDQRITGWTLDFMRRRTDGFKGVMEFLIASAANHFKQEVPMISLSGSPLSNTMDEAAGSELSAIEKILDWLGNVLEPMYGFKSLAAFKSRFQPEHRTLYMYYQDPLALPAIGLAVTAAYLPGLSARQSAQFLRQLAARESIK